MRRRGTRRHERRRLRTNRRKREEPAGTVSSRAASVHRARCAIRPLRSTSAAPSATKTPATLTSAPSVLAGCRSVPAGASSRATDAQLPPAGDRLAWRTVTAPVVKPGPTPGNLRIRAYSPTVSRPIEPGYDTPRRRRPPASRSTRVVRQLRRGGPIGTSRERDAECADSLIASGEGGNGQPRCRASGACGCPGRAAVGDDRT